MAKKSILGDGIRGSGEEEGRWDGVSISIIQKMGIELETSKASRTSAISSIQRHICILLPTMPKKKCFCGSLWRCNV